MIIKQSTKIDITYLKELMEKSSFANKFDYIKGRRLNSNSIWNLEFYFNSNLSEEEQVQFNQLFDIADGVEKFHGTIRELFFGPARPTTSIGSFLVNSVGKNSQTFFTFHIPNTFKAIESINILYVPLFDMSAGQQVNGHKGLELSSTYGSVGEEYNKYQEAENRSIDFQSGKLSKLNVASLYDHLLPDSMCGLKIKHKKLGTIRYLGVEVRFYE